MSTDYIPKTMEVDGYVMRSAIDAVKRGTSKQECAALYNINYRTLDRYVDKVFNDNLCGPAANFAIHINTNQVNSIVRNTIYIIQTNRVLPSKQYIRHHAPKSSGINLSL